LLNWIVYSKHFSETITYLFRKRMESIICILILSQFKVAVSPWPIHLHQLTHLSIYHFIRSNLLNRILSCNLSLCPCQNSKFLEPTNIRPKSQVEALDQRVHIQLIYTSLSRVSTIYNLTLFAQNADIDFPWSVWEIFYRLWRWNFAHFPSILICLFKHPNRIIMTAWGFSSWRKKWWKKKKRWKSSERSRTTINVNEWIHLSITHQILAFSTLIIGENFESFWTIALEKNHSRRWLVMSAKYPS